MLGPATVNSLKDARLDGGSMEEMRQDRLNDILAVFFSNNVRKLTDIIS